MRVLIADDETAARERLKQLLADLDIEVAGEAADGVEALAKSRDLRPDVILLDISMPEADGFDVARHLGDPRPLVIFQTAFSDHAVRAFEHDAIDYVVKPVTRDRLEQAMDRARRRLAERAPRAVPVDVLAQLEAAVGRSRPIRRTRLLVRHGAGHRAVPIRDILRFSAEDGLVYACTTAGRAVTDYTLNELESRLAGSFLRLSRADLVQIDRIDRLVSNGDGSATITLTDGAVVHASRRRAADVRRALA
jgi:DNA-binding LytR/AlgR family response regulator